MLAGVLLLGMNLPVALATEKPRARRVEQFQRGTSTTSTPKKSFFKTRRGILIVSLSALAVGITLWSKQEDRVHSPVR